MLRRRLLAQAIGGHDRSLDIQQVPEGVLLVGRGGAIPLVHVTSQQNIQLFHSPPASPPQPAVLAFHQWRRWIIICLISAIALAGFRSLGQASVQFMMVWQRYSRNGSSRLSNRSPPAPSRLSTIQR